MDLLQLSRYAGSMASELTRSIVRTIRAVPFGKVASYGQIAMLAGHPRGPGGAREVVRILASLSEKENLPWWRIVRKNLSIAFSDPESYALQRQLLEAEGVGFTADGTISRDAQWCGRACEFQDDRFRLPPYPTS